MLNDKIIIRGAREHNLKGINLKLPRNKLIVVTGLSGSGKSSLAFDTIYAEGQRRYMESLSSYARQFLEQLQKPDVEEIQGLSPVISIEQRTAGGNPRSTVATQTEIYDYLRLLFARIGIVHCYQCAQPISRQTSQEIVERLLKLGKDTHIIILAPLISGRKGEYRDIAAKIQKAGFVRFRADGKIYEVRDTLKLERYKLHKIEVVIDRLIIKQETKNRLADSVETALKVGKGVVIISITEQAKTPASLAGRQKELIFSENYACAKCGISYSEVEPRNFSFNSPAGACVKCLGLGTRLEVDPELVIPNKKLTLAQGAIKPWARNFSNQNTYWQLLKSVAKQNNFVLDAPVADLKKEHINIILYGTGSKLYEVGSQQVTFPGVAAILEEKHTSTTSDYLRQEIEQYMRVLTCPA
ncbi:MAG: excinuclease ABC subunit UvrA, partial [Candidatus Omnitrophica bacterium]|nr:excinuclease ABC subunit UvrA [Candidatus Omnitrophota bacterium]